MELYTASAGGESDTTMNYRLYEECPHCHPHKSVKTELHWSYQLDS